MRRKTISLLDQPIEKDVLAYIDFIDSTIPKGKVTDKELIVSYEKINSKRKGKVSLYDIDWYMQDNGHVLFKKFDAYFKKVLAIIRKKAESHPSYKANLFIVNENNFKNKSKILNPKFHDIYGCYYMNYDLAHAAYQKVLDTYDPNKGGGWWGFWSLIFTKNGEIKSVTLSDTVDRDIFYTYLRHQNIIMFANEIGGVLKKVFSEPKEGTAPMRKPIYGVHKKQ